MKVLVLLNPRSGTLATSPTGDEPRRIAEGFAARGVRADVRCLEADAIVTAAEAARDGRGPAGPDGGADTEVGAEADTEVDAVVAGGGDGTLNAVANALAGGDKPFGVLPLGTHNHFAKEMKVPLELDEAVAALADALRSGRTAGLDVGRVNGRVFLNFSAIGLHPKVVRQRDREHEALGRFALLKRVFRRLLKLFALVIALAKAMRRLPVRRVWLTADGQTVRRTTPSVIVCNNAHQMEVFGLSTAAAANRCVLNVLVARATGPAALARLILASLLRRLDKVREFEVKCVGQLKIETRRRRIAVSLDGEVVEMRSPLEYSVLRGGLKVISVG